MGKYKPPKSYPSTSVGGKTKQIHHIIWEKYNGEIPKGMIIHHKDGNTCNPRIANLQCVTRSEHSKIHWAEKKKKKEEKLVFLPSL